MTMFSDVLTSIKMLTNNSIQLVALIAIFLSSIWLSHTLYVRFRPGLRQLPGPRLAAYSRLWNVVNASQGNAHESFQRLHEKYGKVVRTGPNHVAIADPAMIPVIYGTNNKFLKVGSFVFSFLPPAPSDGFVLGLGL